jgi:hypothetical protein
VQLGVCPGPNGRRHVDVPVPKVLVLVERLLQEQVLPAAEQQHRDLHLVERGVESQRRPGQIRTCSRLARMGAATACHLLGRPDNR